MSWPAKIAPLEGLLVVRLDVWCKFWWMYRNWSQRWCCALVSGLRKHNEACILSSRVENGSWESLLLSCRRSGASSGDCKSIGVLCDFLHLVNVKQSDCVQLLCVYRRIHEYMSGQGPAVLHGAWLTICFLIVFAIRSILWCGCCNSNRVGDGCVRNMQVVAVGVWLLSYVMDWLHELELGARYSS